MSLIIIGSSPFADLSRVRSFKFPTLGLNPNVISLCPSLTYGLWVDPVSNEFYERFCLDKKIITRYFMQDNLDKYKKYYQFNESSSIETLKNGLLYCVGSSAIPALNFALVEGYKNVYLYGVDFIGDWNTKEVRHQCKRLVERFKKYLNIYTLNPNSKINVEYRDIREIICQ